ETYSEAHLRARKMSQALQSLGLDKGDVVATLAWNNHRHFESWYAITGIGGVYHTLNPRLFADQLIYIITHAEDKYIFVDLTFVPILEGLQDKLNTVKGFIIYCDEDEMPQTTLDNVHCYETLINAHDGDFSWVKLDENDACGICYTSGTTGNPKGVIYSHRSNVLHSLVAVSQDVMGLSNKSVVMPVVPMFHANAWGLVFTCPMVGAAMVNPGPQMDGASIFELLDAEQVSFTAAVPTVWLMLLQHLEEQNLKLPYLDSVVIGGSAAPRMMIEKFEKDYEVDVNHAWGMTELSPLGTMGVLKGKMHDLSFDERVDIKVKQGRPPYLVQMKITDDDGNELPRDGKTFGNLKVKGPFIIETYMKDDGGEILDAEGYFDTGDVATLDADGFMQITDRSKDVVKSGGEWISSIELENIAVGHPDIVEAAVIGVAHPKWDERPILIVIKKEDADLSREDVLGFMEGKIAKWWMPDDVVFVEEIPHTATGKIQKLALREQFKDYVLPTANDA
ncbi:MAG: long-chain-fatty-acid--CoA ligase, partial [Pseudomonadota bacterium]|nr:long-chain-fatty-acid--CoA ligase [Pseudomonadota bacterium]